MLKMDAEPRRHFRPTVFICDEYQNFATVGGDNPTGDERFLSLSRQPKCIPIVATQSISSLMDALPSEGVKTLLQALRNKVFLTTTDPETARYASELCGKADRTRISYTVSESSANANVGWLSGRTSSSKGSVSASKQYQKHKEPLFEEKVFCVGCSLLPLYGMSITSPSGCFGSGGLPLASKNACSC
jgi:type IV secretory pathway TraG/TraD family ATPase VirD4